MLTERHPQHRAWSEERALFIAAASAATERKEEGAERTHPHSRESRGAAENRQGRRSGHCHRGDGKSAKAAFVSVLLSPQRARAFSHTHTHTHTARSTALALAPASSLPHPLEDRRWRGCTDRTKRNGVSVPPGQRLQHPIASDCGVATLPLSRRPARRLSRLRLLGALRGRQGPPPQPPCRCSTSHRGSFTATGIASSTHPRATATILVRRRTRAALVSPLSSCAPGACPLRMSSGHCGARF